MKKTIAVFTGSRAEYGLLRPLLAELRRRGTFSTRLIVGGSHFEAGFGSTHREILADGFKIDARVGAHSGADTKAATARSIARGVAGCAEALRRLSPSLVVLLGDRFETFACAAAAHALGIPSAHLHGGERTEGSPDDAWRHSVTKLSQLHFTSTEEYRRRVVQLGENPKRVFNVGAPGLDNVRTLRLLSRRELEKELKFSFGARNLLVTLHPSEDLRPGGVLAALDAFPEAKIIFTGSNADAGGRALLARVRRFAARRRGRAACFVSLGAKRYLSVMACVDAVVGNSSSGIIEAPSLGVPTVNVGKRQAGRVRAASVIDCGTGAASVRRAIRKALSPAFRRRSARVRNPYGDGRTAPRIARILESVRIGTVLKKFHDVAFKD